MARTKQTGRLAPQKCVSRPEPDKSLRLLLHAATQNDLKIFKTLISRGKSEIEKVDSRRRTILHYTVINGRLSFVELLLAQNASVEARDNTSFTPLTLAVINGQLKIFNLLLKNGASVLTVCSEGRTLLHYAAKGGHVEIAKVLLRSRVSNKVQDKERRTALDFAIYYHHWDLVKLLLEAGTYQWVLSQPQTQDDDNLRAIAIDNEAVISALKKETETYARNAMEVAARLGREDLIRRFFNEHRCHPQGIKEQRTSPLYVAVENGHHGCVEMLVSHGADVNYPSWPHGTTLECALRLGHSHIAGTLLSAGASIFYNSEDHNSENTTVALLARQEPSLAAWLLSHIRSLKALSIWLIEIANSKHVSILQEYFRIVAPSVQKKYVTDDVPTPIANLVKRLIQSRGTVTDSARALTGASTSDSADIRSAIIAALGYHFVGVFFLVCTVEPETLSEVQSRVPYIHDRARRQLPPLINTQTDKDLITCLSKAGYTHLEPLYDLCEAGSTSEVRERLQAGDEFVDVLGPRNRTPLHAAAQQGHLEIVKLLVDYGADLTARTFRGRTPDQLVDKYQHPLVAAFLKTALSQRNSRTTESSVSK
ncbi:ankyrin repeat-containing domain protein [Fusarium avenaceum]|nr:ankyrin repeat-containing domain protein [Fusarium avenaceum]